jgi:hypothetical protein
MIRRAGFLTFAALAIFGVASVAQAAPVTIDFTGGSSLTTGTAGNSRSFSAGTGGSAITVTATGWSTTDSAPTGTSTRTAAYLGWYSSGLGVTNGSEDGTLNSHTVDNYNGIFDFVQFSFNKAVKIVSITVTPFAINGVTDSDITINFPTDGSNSWRTVARTDFTSTSGTVTTYNINSGTFTSFFDVFASLNTPPDGFKITSMSVEVVPLPSSAWMGFSLLGAFGAVTWRRRRRAIKAEF